MGTGFARSSAGGGYLPRFGKDPAKRPGGSGVRPPEQRGAPSVSSKKFQLEPLGESPPARGARGLAGGPEGRAEPRAEFVENCCGLPPGG